MKFKINGALIFIFIFHFSQRRKKIGRKDIFLEILIFFSISEVADLIYHLHILIPSLCFIFQTLPPLNPTVLGSFHREGREYV
jgi:hypothetical protein